MKKIIVLSSWRKALGNLLPSAHGHQGGSRIATIGSIFMMVFLAACGDDDSWSPSDADNSRSSSVILSGDSHEGSSDSRSSDGKGNSSSEGSLTESSSSSVDKVESSSSSVILSSSEGSCDSRFSDSKGKSSSAGSLTESSSSSADKEESSSSSVILSSSEGSSDSLSSDSKSNSSSEGSLTESSSSSADEVNCSALLEGETGWSWDVPKECRLNPEIEYDSITDSRDGKVYKTVKIGDQVWMAENLNFDPGQGGSGDAKYDWSWCYINEPKNCDVAGRLYSWAAAIDSVKLATDPDNPLDCGYGKTCNLPDTVYGICPPGWHLPSRAEWNALFTAVGGYGNAGEYLKSKTGWKNGGVYGSGSGTDAYGFSALPVGYRYSVPQFYVVGNYAIFWSAAEKDGIDAYNMYLYYYYTLGYFSDYDKDGGLSVRCLKN